MFGISFRLAAAGAAGLAIAAVAAYQPASAQAPQGAAVTAMTNARVIDGTGRPAMERTTILIRDGRIDAVGANVTIPAGATRIDMTGKTIMPGIVSAHGHIQKGLNPKIPIPQDLRTQARMYAAYGVTTVVSLGASPTLEDELEQIKMRDEQDHIALDRARVYTSGRSVRRFKTPAESRADVNRVADLKPDLVKLHFEDPPLTMDAETWGAIIDEGHKRGLPVAAHVYFLADAKAAVKKGVDILGHSVRDKDMDAELLADMKQRGVGLIPTLARELSVFVYETTPAWFKDPFFLRGISLFQEHVDIVSKPEFQEKVRNDKVAQSIKQALVQAKKNVKIAADAGVPIGFGTDGGVPNPQTFGRFVGYLDHVELELLVESGLTPMQAITVATGNSAKMMHLDHLGVIAPGKAADLLVLDANPLQSIKNTQKINAVWLAGRRLPAPGTN